MNDVPESDEVVAYRRRRGVRLMLAALLVSLLFGAAMSVPASTASASSCPSGQVQTFSKYAGSYCIDKPSDGEKKIGQIAIGCLIGAFGATLPSLLGGCATAAAGAIP